MTLEIEFRWVDSGPSIDQLSSVTMAELKITLGGSVLTSHIDRRTHTHGDGITVPLYPVAEWLASWWWPIFHEYGEWSVDVDPEYVQRHDLAFAGAGFVYPSVLLQPTGRFLEVRSRHAAREHSSIEFVREANAQVPLEQAKAELAKVIDAVVEQLQRNGMDGSELELDWNAFSRLSPGELAFSEAAGQFGLDPFDTTDEDAEAIVRLTRDTEPSLRDDLFSLGPPRSAEPLLESIRMACESVDREGGGQAWEAMARANPPRSSEDLPWRNGYAIARWVRDRLELDGDPLVFEGDRTVPTVDLESDRHRLSGVVSSTSPACALRPGRPRTGRRFDQARAVGDYLMRTLPGPSLLTSMRTDRQSRTRSFAAELLAPAEGIRQRLGTATGRRIDEETIDALAAAFDVSSRVIEHQIENHDLGRVAT